jgi:small multidrug resistance pump
MAGMLNYLYLAVAVIAEVTGTVTLPRTNGFTKLAPSIVVVLCYGVAFFMLSLVVKAMPVAVVYAIWAGAGIFLITLAGVVWLRQPLDAAAIIGIVLIGAGVVIISLLSKTVVH